MMASSTSPTGHSSPVIDTDIGGGGDSDSGSGRGEDSQQTIAAVQKGTMVHSDVDGGVDETRQESLPQHHSIVDDHKLNCDQNNLCSDDDNDDFIGDIRHGDEENHAINDHCHDRNDNDGTQQNIGHLSLADTSNGQPTPTLLESSPSQTSQIEDLTQSIQVEHHHMTRRRRKLVPAAVIESDASTAFSQYRPVPPLSTLITEDIASQTADEPLSKKSTGKSRRRRGRRDLRDKKQNRNRRQCMDNNNTSGDAFEDNIQKGNASATLQTDPRQHRPQHHHDDNTIATKLHPNTTTIITDPIHYILSDDDDPILQEYLPQLKFLSDNYYSRVQPYRMGKRNLPLNQIELILRRRAVIKRSDAQREQAISRANCLDREDVVKEGGRVKINSSPSISTIRKPPPTHPSSPPRRKLFPSTTQQNSPTRTHHKADYHDDESTISSTTIASHLIMPAPKQQPIEYTLTPQQPIISSTSCDTAIAISAIPKEEVIGDTSLGLKLTIIQGKVIIQKITPLDDGRASPAQLCGLLSPGDVLIAVNGKSLINGTIHNPVSMDKIITVLKPLSQPMDVVTKEYSREVRLRFVLAEGKALLHEQEEREKQKKHEREMRKKLGLDSGGGIGRGMDPAADLFGIGAFMGVDQHSGMPMFGNLERHHEEEKKNENNMESSDGTLAANRVVAVASVPMEGSDATKAINTMHNQPPPLLFAQARPTVQAQIAQQIHLDRQWIRHRNTSEFFTLSTNAPRLLRPPSPPIDHIEDLDADHSIDARKRRLERGAQIVTNATSLVSVVESQDNGLESFEDEDPMEVASRVCGTATVRTGASRRRWHRGDSVIAEEESSHAASNFEGGTIRSGESGVEACDHRFLVELAANNESWKVNVLKLLDAFALETEKENIESSHGKNNNGGSNTVREEAGATGFDSFLFGGDVAKILGKQKQSMALPPGEMTALLFDLVELLQSGLPNQIFAKEELSRTAASSFLHDKVVSFARNDENADIARATDFLLNEALAKWLKSFRPLPWKQRRALWPTHQSGFDGDSIVSSRIDDDDSLSLTSGTTAQTRSPERHKRNLRELIEHIELDPETRRETCTLVTFFFTRKLRASVLPDSTHNESRLPQSAEDEALTLIDAYGSYLDINTCLIIAGQCHSKTIVDKVLSLASYDSQHKEAVKALERARTLLLYEPNMLSALLDLLPSITKLPANNLDFITLLVSAYPDLRPWSVREASDPEHSSAFYSKYLLALMHHEEGNDAAKRDEALVKEFCLMLCSLKDVDPSFGETHRRSFFHIASRDHPSSEQYHRDLAILMDCSVKMSEFGLALSLANEIISSRRYFRDEQVLLDVLQHVGVISDKAIDGNGGELNTILLGQVISFLSVFSSIMAERECEFDLGEELSKYVEKCYTKHKNNPQKHSSSSVDACITTISENAPPAYSLQILAQWEHACLDSSTFITAIHTSLVSGARDGVRSELSGSLLRIQRSREEGRRPITENGMLRWSGVSVEDEGVEDGGFIWSKVLEGTVEITK